jgi:hypothetical protein
MGMVGGYELHLYCDVCADDSRDGATSGCVPYAGETEADCFRQARLDGWIINRRGSTREGGCGIGHCVCPKHRTTTNREIT